MPTNYYRSCAQPKPEPRKRTKGRQARKEAQIKRRVRAACVERDGYCRCVIETELGDGGEYTFVNVRCKGPSEWAHVKGRRRSQTRGQAAEIRHATKHSLMLCRFHHQQEEAGRLVITYLTARGCDGPIRFSVKEI